MKVYKQYEMENEIDIYLSLSLKNWAAYHQPPVYGCERLLHRARVSTLIDGIPDNSLLPPKNAKKRSPPISRLSLDNNDNPFTVTQLWSLNIATVLHLIA